MSYVNFLGNGTYGGQKSYRRDYYKPDTVSSIGTTHSYKGKVVSAINIENNDPLKCVKEVIIDQAVKVTTVTDKIRAQAQKLWSSLRDGCIGTFTATLIGGISAAIAAVVVGVLLPPLWPIAVAVGVLALGLLGFSAWNLSRGIEAKAQLKQWNDPIPAYQNQRILAEQKGFYHAYSSGYKGKIVSEEELEKLWFTGMDKWADKYEAHITDLKQVKVNDIRTFMEECPLQSRAIAHTFGTDTEVEEEELKFLTELSGKYSSLKGQYDTIRMKTEALKKQIRNERSHALWANDKELQCNLAPYNALISVQKLALIAKQNQYRRVITTYETHVRRLRAQRSRQSGLSHGRVAGSGRVGNFAARTGGRTVTAGGRVVPGSSKMGGHVLSGTRTFGGRVTHVVTTAPVIHVIPAHVKSARADLILLNARLARLDIVYQAMTAPIRYLHAKNEGKIKQWAAGELNKIQVSEDNTLMKFYQPIKALLDAYKHRNDEKLRNDVEVEAKVDFAVNPTAPVLGKDFEPLKYDKKWSEFIGEVDWENGIIKKTTIVYEGNKKVTSSETKF